MILSCAICGKPSTAVHYCGSKKRRPSQEELIPLVKEYDAGATMRALADKYGVDYGYIRRRLIWGGAWIRPQHGRR